jgi:polyisoprenoid-binding protein YceI
LHFSGDRAGLLFAIIALLVVAACSAPPEESPVCSDLRILLLKLPMLKPRIQLILLMGCLLVEMMEKLIRQMVSEYPLMHRGAVLSFTGFGPGKSHSGTFTEMSGEIMMQDGRVVAAEGIIDPASVKSDSAGLDRHLMNEDFCWT